MKQLKLDINYPQVPPNQTSGSVCHVLVLPDRSTVVITVTRTKADGSGHTAGCPHHYWDYLESGPPDKPCTCGATK